MEFLTGLWDYLVPFLIVLTILVFIHEAGHYLVARRNGVRIEVFSIGFGPEIFGWHDKVGTRWKFSLVPLGGYVKMFGDADATSRPDGSVESMTEEERAVAFHTKSVGKRAAVVAAGPAANFLFAIILLAGLFSTVGQPFTPADIGTVQEGSAAEAAGFRPGDVIRRIDGADISRFEDVQQIVRDSPGRTLEIVVARDGGEATLTAIPRPVEITDRFGATHRIGQLGVGRSGMAFVRHDPFSAVWHAATETFALTTGTLDAVGQMIAGTRTTEELGGPLRIAQMSGEMAQEGLVTLIWFMAVLSINLGLINLFPVPMLDGGHLLFYAVEVVRGRPLGPRAQEFGFRIGLALVLALMLFVTWKDLVHLNVVAFFESLLT